MLALQHFDPGQLGKMLILAGLVLLAAGLLVIVLDRTGSFRFPGDLEFGGRNWRVFFRWLRVSSFPSS